MVEPNVTTMVITVEDLQCHKCYKKIKKVLCKIPQIRDQVYDEKKNTVTIKVVCCSPEKIKQKICRKGGKSVICIEILVPKKQEPSSPKLGKTSEKQDPQKQEKKPEKPAPCYPPILVPAFPIGVYCTVCFKGRGDGPCYCGCGFPPSPPGKTEKKVPAPCHPPTEPAPPIDVCCTECSKGQVDGPCYSGCGYPPLRFYEGYCGRPVYDSWGGRYRGGYYVCEENSSACSIM